MNYYILQDCINSIYMILIYISVIYSLRYVHIYMCRFFFIKIGERSEYYVYIFLLYIYIYKLLFITLFYGMVLAS